MRKPGAGRTTKPIVVIDDDDDVREVLAELLAEEGYRVRCFANGAEALDHLRRDSAVAVILLDLMMPVMNGWRFREEQTRDQRLAGIPVIAMSAVMDCEVPPSPTPAALLCKPIDVEALLERVAACAGGHRPN
jgi:CheY-like chemotaxis protein